MKLVCGLLNSRFSTFLIPRISNKTVAKAFPRISVGDLRSFPIPEKLSSDLSRQLDIHIERMLTLNGELTAAKSPDAQTRLNRDIAATDRAIDQLVYQLYGLTADEIRIVEQATEPVATGVDDDAPAAAAPPKPAAYHAQAEADAAHHYLAKEDPSPEN